MSQSYPVPPKWPRKLLRILLRPEYLEEIEGDLEEIHAENCEVYPQSKANWMYCKAAIQLIRPGLIRRLEGNIQLNYYGMFKNYFIVAWRNLTKQLGFSTINILSLTLGITACMLIFLFIKNERMFDGIHSKKDRIYRLCELQTWPGIKPQNVPITWPKMGAALPDYFPEVETYARYVHMNEALWEVQDRKLIVNKAGFVDSTFFDVFDFPLISGNRDDVLRKPNSVLLSERYARRFYGSTDVVGESIKQGDKNYSVVGVFENVPDQSHLQFDVLISLSTVREDHPDFNEQAGSNFVLTYVVLKSNADPLQMETKFPDYLMHISDNEEINKSYSLFLQSLPEVHLASTDIEHDYENHNKFNGRYIDVFVLTGIFIMIIACVNFMNLTIARANTRFKEVGVRKTIGATRGHLIIQFVMESFLLSLIAFIIAMVMVGVAIPYLNHSIDRQLSLDMLWNTKDVTIVILSILILGLVTGLYPAFKMSGVDVVAIVKGGLNFKRKSVLRGSLIVVQFSLSIAMIICTLIVVQQLFFINNKDVGFEKDRIMLIKMNGEVNEKYEVLKEELSKLSQVKGVTASGQRLGNNIHQWGTKIRKDTAIVDLSPSNLHVDYNFLDVYGIELKEGRTFDPSHSNDDGLSFVINESLAEQMGDGSPIGKPMGHSWYPDDSLGAVIGVTKNFNFNSLHHKVNAIALVIHEDWNFSEITVKLSDTDMQEAVQVIDEVWNEHIQDYPLSFEFLDSHFDKVYRSESQMGLVVTWVAVLSVLISCLGLFGLASLSIERRIKEIGVRKVMGASTQQLLLLLSKHFVGLVLLAFLIASPLSYFYLSSWLDRFAFRIDINPLVFLFGGGLAVLIAVFTISYHTVRASRANPSQVLRDE